MLSLKHKKFCCVWGDKIMLSFDAYIALMLGDLVALIVAIIFEFLNTKNNKPGRKKRKILIGIICIAITIGIGLTIFYQISKKNETKATYAMFTANGEFEYSNSNWIEAAEWFSKASMVAYDSYSEAYALQQQGTCYLVHALYTNDKDYYVKALTILKNVVDNPKYEEYQSYQIAMIDLCSIYCFLGYDWTNNDWSSVVNYLEITFNFEDIEDVDKEYLTILVSAGINICLYYNAVMQSSPQLLLYNEEYQNKAIYYLRATSEVELLYNEYRGISVYEEVYHHTLYQMTSTIITNAFFNANDKESIEDVLLRLEDARKICQNAISTLNIGDGNLLQLVIYLQLKRNIGKTYLFSAFAKDYDINMAKAYQEFMIPFYWEDDRVVEELLITASYALMTGCCTETDIEMILDNCIQRIQNLRKNTNVAELIEAEFDLLLFLKNNLGKQSRK